MSNLQFIACGRITHLIWVVLFTFICMSTKDHSVTSWDAEALVGVPVFTGTRVPVDTLSLSLLKAGNSLAVFLEDFPRVSTKQAGSALDLASELLTVEFH